MSQYLPLLSVIYTTMLLSTLKNQPQNDDAKVTFSTPYVLLVYKRPPELLHLKQLKHTKNLLKKVIEKNILCILKKEKQNILIHKLDI